MNAGCRWNNFNGSTSESKIIAVETPQTAALHCSHGDETTM